MEKYLYQVESWMSQIVDDTVETKDYDFVDRVVKEGDGNLANIGTYLAIYENMDNLAADGEGIVAGQNLVIGSEKDKDISVDDEFLKSLDDMKTEISREEAENPGRIQERTNHRETVYGQIGQEDREKVRKGETTVRELREKGETKQNGLLDGSFAGKETGHEFIYSLLKEFKEIADYNTSVNNNAISSKTSCKKSKGGEKIMTDYDEFDELADFVDYAEDVIDAANAGIIDMAEAGDEIREAYEREVPNEQMDRIEERYKDLGHAVRELVDDSYDVLGDLERTLTVQEQRKNDKVNNAEAHANYLGNRLDSIEDTQDDIDRMLGR